MIAVCVRLVGNYQRQVNPQPEVHGAVVGLDPALALQRAEEAVGEGPVQEVVAEAIDGGGRLWAPLGKSLLPLTRQNMRVPVPGARVQRISGVLSPADRNVIVGLQG